MALNVTKFFDKRPYLPYRFEVEIYYRTLINEPYRYTVQNISFPKMEGSMSDSSIFLGNSIIPLQTYNVASRQLEITFEESDNMMVNKLLNVLSYHAYSGVSELIGIIVYEYDSTMRINLNTSKIYKCKILSYENPSFSRTGSVNVITLSASFSVFSESPYSDYNKSVMITDIKNKNRSRNAVKDLNANDIISINKEKSILKANPQYNVNLVTPQAPQGGYGGMGGSSGNISLVPSHTGEAKSQYSNVLGNNGLDFLEMSKNWGYNHGGKLSFDKNGNSVFIDLDVENENDVKRANLNGTKKGIDCIGFVAALVVSEGGKIGNGSQTHEYSKNQLIIENQQDQDAFNGGGIKGFNFTENANGIYNGVLSGSDKHKITISKNSIIKDVYVMAKTGDIGHVVAEVEIDGELYIVESAGGTTKNNGVRKTKKSEWFAEKNRKQEFISFKEHNMIVYSD